MNTHPRHHVGQSADSSGVSDFLGSIPGPYQAGQSLGQGASDLYHAAADALQQVPTASSISAAQGTVADAVAAAQTAIANANVNATEKAADVQAAAAQASQQMTTVIVLAAIGVVLAIYLTRK